ncbi:MAG: HEPN domain-containing protein [Firmicutes bacterium]|nr:HEPN domain-containing protein [Bacillota bacterium]HXL04111.1 HEPN domain-containing protein [Bacillota bacterium]
MKDNPWEMWIRRARSNLVRAKQGRQCDDVLYEDLCFDAQQAAEKCLKGLLIYLGRNAPRTHSIGHLLNLIRESGKVTVPPEVTEAVILNEYAVTTRYPGDWEPVTREEYEEAVRIADEIWNWVTGITGYA